MTNGDFIRSQDSSAANATQKIIIHVGTTARTVVL